MSLTSCRLPRALPSLRAVCRTVSLCSSAVVPEPQQQIHTALSQGCKWFTCAPGFKERCVNVDVSSQPFFSLSHKSLPPTLTPPQSLPRSVCRCVLYIWRASRSCDILNCTLGVWVGLVPWIQRLLASVTPGKQLCQCFWTWRQEIYSPSFLAFLEKCCLKRETPGHRDWQSLSYDRY